VNKLINKIAQARDVAADRESDIRIKEFLRAIAIRSDGYEAERLTLEVVCHFRSWQKCIRPVEAAELAEMSHDDLAGTVAGWVRDAIKEGLLLLSNPPFKGRTDQGLRTKDQGPSEMPRRRKVVCVDAVSVGAIVTHTFDKSGNLVGTRWG
jgi:hypothetical protein